MDSQIYDEIHLAALFAEDTKAHYDTHDGFKTVCTAHAEKYIPLSAMFMPEKSGKPVTDRVTNLPAYYGRL